LGPHYRAALSLPSSTLNIALLYDIGGEPDYDGRNEFSSRLYLAVAATTRKCHLSESATSGEAAAMTVRTLKTLLDSQRLGLPTGDAVLAPGKVLGRKGPLTVRVASGQCDIDAAQSLRYRVFYEELSARADDLMRRQKRDGDAFDDICDHLLVIAPPGVSGETDPIMVDGGEAVGTYRLLRQEVAERNWGFYTADEYDIGPLLRAHGSEQNFLELGRSCVLGPFRTKPVIELLWQGIWNYVRIHRLDVMLGCASLEGTDADAMSLELSFLSQHFRAPANWAVSALPERRIEMNRMPADAVDPRAAMRKLPPLIKGYLRLGAYIGDGAVIDTQFNTIDVLIVLPVSAINERYFSHFGAPDKAPVVDA
jgi:putative hemolysin